MFNISTKSFVQKRDGLYQEMCFAKIQNRLNRLAKGYPFNKTGITKSKEKNKLSLEPLNYINTSLLTQKVIKSVENNMSTNKIDELTASICAESIHIHPDYNEMASRIIISNHHKNTRTRNFLGMTEYLYLNKDSLGINCPLVNKDYYKFVEKNYEKIEELIKYERDYDLTYFGFKTLEKSYLLRPTLDKCPIEKPQDMFMRVAIAVNIDKTWDKIEETYNFISLKYYTHASPTIFNAGTMHQQLLSCFLLGSEDSQEGIMKTASDI